MIYLNKAPDRWPNKVGFDVETNGLDPYANKVLLTAVSDGNNVWVFTKPHVAVADLITDPSILKIAHNAVFDMKWFKHKCLEPRNFACTQVTHQLLDAGRKRPRGYHALDNLLASQLGVLVDKDVRMEFIDHPGFSYRPLTPQQLEYSAKDVLYLPRLYDTLMEKISEYGLGKTLRIEYDFLPVVMDMELFGMELDLALWNQYEVEIAQRLEVLLEEIKEFLSDLEVEIEYASGIKVITAENFNLNSVDHKKAILAFLGEPVKSTDKTKVLAPLLKNSTNERAKQFVRYLFSYIELRAVTKMDYAKYVNPISGNVHPSWHQLGARTGRLSCSKPNFTNIMRPVEGLPNLRHIWKPTHHTDAFVIADYAQQEVRIMSVISGDEELQKACQSTDVYVEFAKRLFDVENVSTDQRYVAKQFVLATGYGSGARKLSETSGLPLKRCNEIRDLVRKTYPVMASFGDKMYQQAKYGGFVTTATGRRRWFNKDDFALYTESVNSPIQGTAADMTKLAATMIRNDMQERGIGGFIANIIHDELMVQVSRDIAEEYRPVVEKLMVNAAQEICPGVTYIAEGRVANRWEK